MFDELSQTEKCRVQRWRTDVPTPVPIHVCTRGVFYGDFPEITRDAHEWNGVGHLATEQRMQNGMLVVYSAMGDEGDNSNDGRSVTGELGAMDTCAPHGVPAERRVARTTSDLHG